MKALTYAEEDLGLHIFISIMVLIRDFEDAFSRAYAEPAEREVVLSIQLISLLFNWVIAKVAKKHGEAYAHELADKLEAFLITKIKSDLAISAPDLDLAVEIRAEWASIADKLELYHGNKTFLFQDMTNTIMAITDDISPQFEAYALERVTRLLTKSVNFDELVAKLIA